MGIRPTGNRPTAHQSGLWIVKIAHSRGAGRSEASRVNRRRLRPPVFLQESYPKLHSAEGSFRLAGHSARGEKNLDLPARMRKFFPESRPSTFSVGITVNFSFRSEG